MDSKKGQANSDTDSAGESEMLRTEVLIDHQRCTYLPKGHEVINKIKTVTVSGVQHTVTADETVNQSIIEAANITIRKAFSRKRSWDPEDIIPELMKQEPFKSYPESYIRTRALNAWKDLNKKLRDKQEKQSKGLLDVSRKTINPQMESLLGELETLNIMLDELEEMVESQKLQEKAKRPTIIKAREKQNVNDGHSFLKPCFGRSDEKAKSVSLLKPLDRGVKRVKPAEETRGANSYEENVQEEPVKRRELYEKNVRGEQQKNVRGDQQKNVRGEQQKNVRGEQQKRSEDIQGPRGPKFRRDEGEDENSIEDSIQEKKEGIEKARLLRQRATYGDSNTGSDTESSGVDKKQRVASETPDTDHDASQDLLGFDIRKFQASVDKTNELTERELLLRERELGINQDNNGAANSGNGVNVGASASGLGQVNEASRSGTVLSPTNDERLAALELQMALLLSKVDELIELQSERGAGSN